MKRRNWTYILIIFSIVAIILILVPTQIFGWVGDAEIVAKPGASGGSGYVPGRHMSYDFTMEPPATGGAYWLFVDKMDGTNVTTVSGTIPGNYWTLSGASYYLPVGTYKASFCYSSESNVIAYDVFTVSLKKSITTWVRTMPMMCQYVWINEDNMFQFVFLYPFADNNWVRIYAMNAGGTAGEMVFEADMPWDNPNLIVDLPDGMYIVRTYHTDFTTPIQEFVIGKPAPEAEM